MRKEKDKVQLSEGSLITIIIFLIVQTGGLIWAFATLTANVKTMETSLKNLSDKLIFMEASYAKKEDISKDIHYQEKRIDAIFSKLDKIET